MNDWFEKKQVAWNEFVIALQKWKRECFSQVCLEVCQHHCCDLQNTVLKAPQQEIAVLIGHSPDDWSRYQTDEPGLYRYAEGDCPHYERPSRRCKIWNNPQRPPICGEFPFGLYHDDLYRQQKMYLSPACAFGPGMPGWESLARMAAQHQVQIVRLKAASET